MATRERYTKCSWTAEREIVEARAVGRNVPAPRARRRPSLFWKWNAMKPTDARMYARTLPSILPQADRANERNASSL
jgi:hypothetical protein